MKNVVPALFFLLIQLPAISQSNASDKLASRTLEKEQMVEDFKFLRKVLEETHPALYRYAPKDVMQRKMDSIAGMLTKPMPFYDYYLLLTSLIADIRCAHTYIIPKQNLGEYSKDIKTLPFEIIPVGDRLYITLNGTADTVIRPGYELLAINGKPVSTVLQTLYRYVWADGYIQSSKTSQIVGARFGFYYYLMVERPDSFLLSVRDLQGRTREIKAPALSSEVYNPLFFKNPVNKQLISLYLPRNKKDQENGWRLEILDEPNTALLRIKGFNGGKDGEEAAKKMQKFMEKNIAQLKKKKIQHLIVDLRNNGGGWDIQGIELFTYLMKDTVPVRYYRRQHTITDSSEFFRFSDISPEDRRNIKNLLIREADGTFSVKEELEDDLKLKYPKAERFTQNVYFLVNGGTGSSASEFAAVAYSNRLGLFIGDETGGAYEGGNSGSFLHFQLPNSSITVGTPLVYYDNGVKEPAQKGRGVIPEYPVYSSIEDILKGRDAAFEFTMELIRKSK